jgi:gas vesicle protein
VRVRSLLLLVVGGVVGAALARLLDPVQGGERRRQLAVRSVREIGRSVPRLRRLGNLTAELVRSLAAGYREADRDTRLRPVA